MRFLLILLLAVLPASAFSQYAVLVAPKDSEAYEFAKTKENGETVFAERKLFKGLNQAAELLNAGGERTVTVFVAAGTYTGQFGAGVWKVPHIDNPQGTLRVMAGFNDDFSGRQPFGLITELQTVEGRDGAIFQLAKRSRLKEVVVSGLLLDAGPSNAYDARTNSIKKGQSRSYPLLSLSMLETDRLVVADNIFLNGAHGAFDPYVKGASASANVLVQNNLFLNTIKAFKNQPATTKALDRLTLKHNSFVLCWPFNPDPTSSNVGAIELYHSGGFENVDIEGNLFAYNPGGAMQHDWAPDRMPNTRIAGNLFYSNAALYEDGETEAGVIVGKFGTNPIYRLLDLESVEDDLDYDVEDNVSFDPQIPIVIAPLQAADSYGVSAQNTTINQVRSLFGLNTDGGTVAIANFAPRLSYRTDAVPFPTNEAAKAYGVQPGALWQ
ncbi:MAG: hypothetical protein AAGI08_14050 [Bacteroidota bacterium]